MQDVISEYRFYQIPVDTIWSDIDYMWHYQDFTINDKQYMPEVMNKWLLEEHLHYVPIIDAGVAIGENDAYKEGVEKDLYIKNAKGDYLLGKVWPGYVNYPDFFHPNATGYWSDQLTSLQNQVNFTGIWLDMNEASNFCDGECALPTPSLQKHQSTKNIYSLFKSSMKKKLSESIYSNLPYTPGNRPLYQKTLSQDATHYQNLLEYDVHNYFGFLESRATYDYLKDKAGHGLPFILTRSTVPGSGRYTAHWGGDNKSSWEFLKLSISGMLKFNIYGIPHYGADICGFNSDTTPELCARWI